MLLLGEKIDDSHLVAISIIPQAAIRVWYYLWCAGFKDTTGDIDSHIFTPFSYR